MKAAAILPHTYLCGGVQRFIELGRVFRQQGHEFTIYTPSGDAPDWTCNDVRVATFSELESECNDMLFVTDNKYRDIFLRAKSRFKIFYHVNLRHTSRMMLKDPRFHIFAGSSNVALYDRFFFGRHSFLAAGGIDTQKYQPGDTPRDQGKKQFTILVYGNLYEKVKETLMVIKACNKLYGKYPSIRLVVFDSPSNRTISEKILRYRTHMPVNFVTDYPAEENILLFHQADLFVGAETGSGWAGTVAQAMACGLPVVALRDGTTDILIDGITGIAVRKNVRSIARGIGEFLESPEACERIGLNAKGHIQKFTWNILGCSMIGWYQEQLRATT
jgi:glycosyltransferase involved in cell wall biosynthesis